MPLREASSVSASLPSISRQRRRRSASSIAIGAHPQNLREDRKHPARTLDIDTVHPIIARVRVGYASPHMIAAQMLDLLAHRAAFGRLEIREGAAQEGQQFDERLRPEVA